MSHLLCIKGSVTCSLKTLGKKSKHLGLNTYFGVEFERFPRHLGQYNLCWFQLTFENLVNTCSQFETHGISHGPSQVLDVTVY